MIDKYFISYYYSAEKYALYANGSSQIPLVGIVVNSVMAVLFPRLVELRKSGDTRTMLNLWHEAIRKVSLFMYPVFAFCFVMAKR